MTKIYFKKSNQILVSEVEEGQTLLDAAKKINITEITADCRGNCACGTCHVHIYIASLEPYLLEKSKHYNEKLSRLCCQIDIKDSHDGLVVHLLE